MFIISLTLFFYVSEVVSMILKKLGMGCTQQRKDVWCTQLQIATGKTKTYVHSRGDGSSHRSHEDITSQKALNGTHTKLTQIGPVVCFLNSNIIYRLQTLFDAIPLCVYTGNKEYMEGLFETHQLPSK